MAVLGTFCSSFGSRLLRADHFPHVFNEEAEIISFVQAMTAQDGSGVVFALKIADNSKHFFPVDATHSLY
jgi:hypothetical protein